MTQQEMDMVISSAIRFGQNTDMSGELHNVKMLNLELQEENNELRTKYSANESLINSLQEQMDELADEKYKSDLNFFSCNINKPEHGQLCLCIAVPNSVVIEPKHLLLAKYNDKAKYWDSPDADVDNDSHDDGLYDYGDYHIKYFMPINIRDFKVVY